MEEIDNGRILNVNKDSGKYDAFFSYNWQDCSSVEFVANRLREQGIDIFLDRWYLIPGRLWPLALEEVLSNCFAVVIFLGPHGMGSWQQREMFFALNRQTHDLTFSVIPVILPGAEPALGFLSINTWIDLRSGLDDPLKLKVLGSALRGYLPEVAIQEKSNQVQNSICPYRGLRPFREEDADFFFGREILTERLLGALSQHNFIGVIGASGSGKSSVVRAGLLPRLRGCRERGGVWDIITLVPGYHPLSSLAASLIPAVEPKISEIDRLAEIKRLGEHFAHDSISLCDVVTRILDIQQGTNRLLLFVDQWEELYTLCQSNEERNIFIEHLLRACIESPLSVVLTLRGDFFGYALDYRPLADQLQGAIVNIGPMTAEELKQAVTEPAQTVGLIFESGLVNRILQDVQKEPGNLPLLEFVLMRLWEVREGENLLHKDYENIGGLQGSVASRAEDVYCKFSSHEREITQSIFLQLVRLGEGTDDTRRRATFAELERESDHVILQLADSRLIVTGRDESSGEATLEISHEALIRSWTRLQEWIAKDREFLLWHQRLRLAFEEWRRTNRDSGVLLRGALLTEAERWLNERPDDLKRAEVDYIKESSLRQKEELAVRDRLRRRLTLFSVGSAIFFLLVAIVVAIQWYKSKKTVTLVRNNIGRIRILDDGPSGLTWKLYPRPNGQEDETMNQWNMLTDSESAIAAGKTGDPAVEVKGGTYWLALFNNDEKRPQVIPIRSDGYPQYLEPLIISTASFPAQPQVEEGMIAIDGDENLSLSKGTYTLLEIGEDLHFKLHPFYVDKVPATPEEIEEFTKSTGWQLATKDGEILLNWYDAQAYCMWRRKRLLTAAEIIQMDRTQAKISVYTVFGGFGEIKNYENTVYIKGEHREIIWDWGDHWLQEHGILGPASGYSRGNYSFTEGSDGKPWRVEFWYEGGGTPESRETGNAIRCGCSHYDDEYIKENK